MTIEELKAAVVTAKNYLTAAELALSKAEQLPENNVYESLEKVGALEEILRGQASDDCEGAHNCGNDRYMREFMVDGVVYVAMLDVDYNRHDKTYYYIEESYFNIKPK